MESRVSHDCVASQFDTGSNGRSGWDGGQGKKWLKDRAEGALGQSKGRQTVGQRPPKLGGVGRASIVKEGR